MAPKPFDVQLQPNVSKICMYRPQQMLQIQILIDLSSTIYYINLAVDFIQSNLQ